MTTQNIIVPFKLVFNPVSDDTRIVTKYKSTLEFQYPQGVRHAYSFFVYPDSVIIHNDLTNDVINAEKLTNGVFKNLPLSTLEYLDPKKINSDLFHKYLKHIVDLFNYYSNTNLSIDNLKLKMYTDIQCYNQTLLCDTFELDYSKGVPNLHLIINECALISAMLTLNILNILWCLLPDEIADKKITQQEIDIYRLLNQKDEYINYSAHTY